MGTKITEFIGHRYLDLLVHTPAVGGCEVAATPVDERQASLERCQTHWTADPNRGNRPAKLNLLVEETAPQLLDAIAVPSFSRHLLLPHCFPRLLFSPSGYKNGISRSSPNESGEVFPEKSSVKVHSRKRDFLKL